MPLFYGHRKTVASVLSLCFFVSNPLALGEESCCILMVIIQTCGGTHVARSRNSHCLAHEKLGFANNPVSQLLRFSILKPQPKLDVTVSHEKP